MIVDGGKMRPPNHLDASVWVISHHKFNRAEIQLREPGLIARLTNSSGEGNDSRMKHRQQRKVAPVM